MKLLLEKWREILNEVDDAEQAPAEKAAIFNDAQTEVKGIVTKVSSAAGNDTNLARETLQSIIAGLQQALEEL
tara:strand:+ start:900 stop:1118 length:219 start_codon:yes stop_codon:yes gene_type:complete